MTDEPAAAALKGHRVRAGGGSDAGDGRGRVNHALEQWDGLFAGVSGHAEVGLCEGNVVRLEAEGNLQGASHASHSDQRCGDEKGADGDLYNEQDVAECEAAKGLRLEGSSLDGLENVGVPYLPAGRRPKRRPLTIDKVMAAT